MIDKESIRYSLRNLNSRKRRSFLTVFSILVGIATIFIFISFGMGLYKYVGDMTSSSSANKVLIMAKGSGIPGSDDTFKLTDDDLNTIEKSAGVLKVTGIYYDVSEIKRGKETKYTYLIGYEPKEEDLLFGMFNVGLEKGRYLQSGETKAAIFGYNYLLPNKIFEKPLELNDIIEINGEKVKAVGFMGSIGNPSDDSQIYVTNDYFLDLVPDKESYAEIIAQIDIANVEQVISNIERDLRKERNLEKGKEDFFVQSFDDMIESYSSALDVVIGFIILIALISVVVSGINTANTMITSVLERYKEIGVLKAIGARNLSVFNIFLFESAFLGFVSGVLGILLGYGMTSLFGAILTNLGWGFLQPHYNFWLFSGCILFAVLTSTISGVFPAIRASKINPVNALRYE